MPRVDAFETDDARVVAQPPVELVVTDVERDHAAAPRSSRTSVKPPVEAPMSSAFAPRTSRREHVERVRELQAAAADPRVIGLAQRDLAVSSTGVPAFVTRTPSTSTSPARMSARARSRDWRKAARDEQLIEPRFRHALHCATR